MDRKLQHKDIITSLYSLNKTAANAKAIVFHEIMYFSNVQ